MKQLTQYATQKEAITIAKSRTAGNYRTHYIYRARQDGEDVFSVSTRFEQKNPPIIKVLYGGKVEQLDKAAGAVLQEKEHQ